MKQTTLWRDSDTFILSSLEFYNWGGFQGYHHADIDPAGTAIIGPTGSGKTTLVDALMTLLCAQPRYNLASTGGHESDRDLVSYVRGVSGPGDGGPNQAHIARPGKTVTAIAATFERDGQQVRLGALLWFEGTSSTASDLKKLWLFSEAAEQTLDHWLNQHHAGGMRTLRQMEKEGTGIWTYPSKQAYLARLRDYFEVGENAFILLNRAAGLKQLNSIDEIFRELVLDDRSAFERAAEVAGSFDNLTEIHRELDIARQQQRALQPIAESWARYQTLQTQQQEQQALESVLPIWFAEQGYRLWLAEAQRLEGEVKHAEQAREQGEHQLNNQQNHVDQQRQRYLQTGGATIDQLGVRIAEWVKTVARCESQAAQYQRFARNLDLSDELSLSVFQDNQRQSVERRQVLAEQIAIAHEHAFTARVTEKTLKDQLHAVQQEHAEVMRRPGSNLHSAFQVFRTELAAELALDEQALPYVAELVQVKPEQQRWRGAIERAIGSHRLRILVPAEAAPAALRWVNQRNNRLHVRLLEVKAPTAQPRFFDDGFTHKLAYKTHPYRESLKALLADNDRHCVDTPEQLRHTPHAMTAQGMMSGKERFFDKQDQKRLDDDWLTGFDNRDRLALLAEQIKTLNAELAPAHQAMLHAQDRLGRLEDQVRALARLEELHFDDIDVPGATAQLESLRRELAALTQPDCDLAVVKAALDDAEAVLKAQAQQLRQLITRCATVVNQFEQADAAARKAFRGAEQGMNNTQRELAARHLPVVTPDDLENILELERTQARAWRQRLDATFDKLGTLKSELASRMSDALKVDTGALSDVGRELVDVPSYLERLRVLTEEALPDKLKRFLDYLNRSSDDGVTQLLSYIEHEVALIEERLDDLNSTMRRVDFEPGRYLRLVASKVIHDSLSTLQKAQRKLHSARFADDAGETQYKALQALVALLKDACERHRTQGARALLDPRFRLSFAVAVIDRENGTVIQTRTGSQGGSGGEKEIIASYVLTASLSDALCPDGSSRPLFGTIVLDEAFSRSSHAVAGRIIAALKEFGLHAMFITPNKEMRLLRHHTRSAIVVHRRGSESSLVSLSWAALDEFHQQRGKDDDEEPR
jgi:uncharacterized protein YPO0396